MSEEYVPVYVTIKRVTPAAVLVESEYSDEPVWIPRSLIHGADERAINADSVGDKITLRIFRWKAKHEGLI